MASDLSSLSILGRNTDATTPKSNRQKSHFVTSGEDVLAIANREYGNKTYDPAGWRRILEENDIDNPFAFSDLTHEESLVGTMIIIPPAPLPETFS